MINGINYQKNKSKDKGFSNKAHRAYQLTLNAHKLRWTEDMKKFLLLLSLFVLAGCEYQARLVTTPEKGIEKELLGTWQRKGKDAKLQIFKLNDNRYFVFCDSAQGIATPCSVDDIPLFQTEFLTLRSDGTKKLNYELMYWRCRRDGESLKVACLNSRLVPYKTPTREKLIEAIRNNLPLPPFLDH